jgi:hypothetical protein
MFTKTVLEIDSGATVNELTEALQRVNTAVRATGKAGSVTLIVKIAPATKGATDVVAVRAEVKTKIPEPERRMAICDLTDSNGLSKSDPKQQTLDLRVVDIGDQPKQLKEVG